MKLASKRSRTARQGTAGPASPTNPGRRRSIQAGLAAAAAITSSQAPAPAFAKDLPRPRRLTPFVVPLAIPPIKQNVGALAPASGEQPCPGEARRAPHQAWDYPQRWYELDVGPGTHSFHPEMPPQTIWGYDRVFPGPTFVERYGTPAVVRIHNNLKADANGPGTPQITTHLHNLHCASISDGFPVDFYPGKDEPGLFRDHHYPHSFAGGDEREALGTLWYHDHCLFFTAANVYRGLAGFYLLFDQIDSGDENDPSPTALRLPSGVGKYDIPLLINDPRIDASGYLLYDQFENDGHLGNVFCVNGKISPYFKVERRKYRFRMLNASLARFYELYLCTSSGANQAFDYIANDGNLLPAPLRNERKVALAPAERGEIVVDFSAWPVGTKLYLVNRLVQTDGRGPALGWAIRAVPTASLPRPARRSCDSTSTAILPSRMRAACRTGCATFLPCWRAPGHATGNSTGRTTSGRSTASCSTRSSRP